MKRGSWVIRRFVETLAEPHFGLVLNPETFGEYNLEKSADNQREILRNFQGRKQTKASHKEINAADMLRRTYVN